MSTQPGKAGDKPKQPNREPAVVRAVAPPPPPPLPRKLSRSTIILWLIAAGMLILFLPLSLIASGISDDTKRTTADLVSVQVSLTSVPTPVPEILALNGTLTALQQQKAQVDVVLEFPIEPAEQVALLDVLLDLFERYVLMILVVHEMVEVENKERQID